MITLLETIRHQKGRTPNIALLAQLIDKIRPQPTEDIHAAIERIEELIEILQKDVALRREFRNYIWAVFECRNQLKLYTDAGVLSNRPFLSETWKKFQYKFLPPLPEFSELSYIIGQAFPRKTDYQWVSSIPDILWLRLLETSEILAVDEPYQEISLSQTAHDSWETTWFTPWQEYIYSPENEWNVADEEIEEEPSRNNRQELLNAIVVLSQRITTMGMEPEIVSKLPQIDDLNSPFLRLNAEVMQYAERVQKNPEEGGYDEQAYRNALALIRRCEKQLAHLRRHREEFGVSITLTHLVKRLEQHNHRLKALLLVLLHPDADKRHRQIVRLFKEFVRAENTKFSLIAHLSTSSSLLAYQVLENTSKRGETYAIESRQAFGNMFRAALGGGFIVAWLCCFKLQASLMTLSPFGKAFLYSMNYAVGFMLIHIFRFTLATKQPAVTASTIAETLDRRHGRRGLSTPESVALIRKITQAQTISLLGNVLMAFPVAYLLATAYHALTGHHIAPVSKAEHLLEDLHPFHSLSLLHAAFAGVFLMTSGLISGFYDNKVVYDQIPARLRKLPILRRILPPMLLIRVVSYIEKNLGALAGNFYLGIFLGSLSMIGGILGLPLDIRHITFAAGNFGLALVSLDGNVALYVVEMTAIGVLFIGLVNVFTSFGLSITIALKSRNIAAKQAHAFFFAILLDFIQHPLSYILPIRRND